MLALDNLEYQVKFLNSCLPNPCMHHYIVKRCKLLQIRINRLYKLADDKGGRVKEVLYSGLESIQAEIDSILWAIE